MPESREKKKSIYDRVAGRFISLLIGASSLSPMSAQAQTAKPAEGEGTVSEWIAHPGEMSREDYIVSRQEIAPSLIASRKKGDEVKADTSLYAAVGSKSHKKQIEAIVAAMQQSRVGRALLKEAKDRGYSIGMRSSMPEGVYGQCMESEKKVYLNPTKSRDCQVHALAHELAHALQNGVISNNAYRPNVLSQLMICTAVEAGANTMALLVCQELEQLGEKGPKRNLAAIHGTMVRIFDSEMKKAGGDLTDKAVRDDVLTKTFLGWYRQPGEVGTDIYTTYIGNRITDMEQMLKEHPENFYLTSRCSPERLVEACCRIPGTEDNFFNRDPKVLSSEECVRILPAHERRIERMLEKRLEKNPSFPPDESYKNIAVVPRLDANYYSREYKEEKRQEEARRKIGEYQKEQENNPDSAAFENPLTANQRKDDGNSGDANRPSRTRVPRNNPRPSGEKGGSRTPPRNGAGRNPPLPRNPRNNSGRNLLSMYRNRRSSKTR